MNARPFYAMMDAPAMQAHLEGAVLAAAQALGPFVLSASAAFYSIAPGAGGMGKGV